MVEPGRRLSHYRLVEKIGEGGMGVVFRAVDEHLERDVAIKVLPARTLGDESARKRFRREALALSKLNHPNIAVVHDFDSQDGIDFLVMEYIAGVTLDERIADGPLAEAEILSLGEQLADGLVAAHEHGILHRDLKPGNLRITTDGRLKILDFGLAKLLRPVTETAPTETQTRGIVGTLAYMAPEQLGGKTVDARTDIYAAGVALYEMATGTRPFVERETARLLYAIVHNQPKRIRESNPQISAGLEAVILKAMAKAADERYDSAGDLKKDLNRAASELPTTARLPRVWHQRRVLVPLAVVVIVAVLLIAWWWLRSRAPGPSEENRAVAVLPLEALARGFEEEIFADGMTAVLTADLSKLSGLTVIAKRSVMQFKDSEESLSQIAAALGADVMVEGTVQRLGDSVRITVNLIDANTERQLWGDHYEGSVEDVFLLQSEIARTIAREVEVQISPQEANLLASAQPVNQEAYNAYLLGRYYWNQVTVPGLERSIEYYNQAIEADPDFALAYYGLADSYQLLTQMAAAPAAEYFPLAKAALLKAIELDDSLAEAHSGLALYLASVEWDWEAAGREYLEAIRIDPNSANSRLFYSQYLNLMQRHDEALEQILIARRLDPLSKFVAANVGHRYALLGRFEEALEATDRALELALIGQ